MKIPVLLTTMKSSICNVSVLIFPSLPLSFIFSCHEDLLELKINVQREVQLLLHEGNLDIQIDVTISISLRRDSRAAVTFTVRPIRSEAEIGCVYFLSWLPVVSSESKHTKSLLSSGWDML